MTGPPLSPLDLALIEDIAGFHADPLGFVWYAFPWGEDGLLKDEPGPDEWQTAYLRLLADKVSTEGADAAIRVATASGHGVGKTAVIAWVVLWFMSTREFPQIVVTASTQQQLSSKTWRELAKWHRLALNRHWFTWTATKFAHAFYPETWFASAIPWSDHNADAFAGTHEKFVLIIYDEANAVADRIFDVSEGALTTPGALWLVFGQYSRNSGRFHECFAAAGSLGAAADRQPHGKANQEQIRQWVEDYGEDSDFVRIRVRGVAPRAGSSQFVPQDLADQRYRAEGYETAPRILALDVARFGDNQSVAILRQGRRATIRAKWRGLALDQLTDRFIEIIDETDPDAIVVDGDGIGGAVVDMLRRRNYDRRRGRLILTEFHGASPANNERMWYNRRAEVWGEMRDALKDGVELPDDPELRSDLVGPEYTFTTKGGLDLIRLESKDDMRGRGVASPDCGDALAMSYAVKLQGRAPLGSPGNPLPLLPREVPRPGGDQSWMGV